MEQEQRDQEALARYEAGRAREWEDWAVRSEMDTPSVPKKRVRLTLVIGSTSGQNIAEGVVEGTMLATEQPMVTMSLVEQPLPDHEPVVEEEAATDAASAATVMVPPEEVAQPSSNLIKSC